GGVLERGLMDGCAVRCADLPGGGGRVVVQEEVTAGQVPKRPVAAGCGTRIMTGAPLPEGADAVVPVERTRPDGGGRVRVEDPGLRPEANILRRGREMRASEVVLRRGAVLRPPELGLLATVGRTSAGLIPPPRLSVLATGDELVEASGRPARGQIRNGNGPMLLAQAARAGAVPCDLGIARDTEDNLRE